MAKKGRTKSYDFTDVTAFKRVGEGLHKFKISDIDETESSKGDDMLKFTMEVVGGIDKGGTVFENVALPGALFKLKTIMEACGIEVPNGKMKVDLDKLIGKTFWAEVVHNEDGDKTYANIDEYKNGEPEDIEDDEDEIPATKAKGKGKAKAKAEEPEDEDEDDDFDDDEDDEEDDDDEVAYEDMDLEELRDAAKEAGIKKYKTKKRKELLKELNDLAEYDDDDEDWED